MEQTFPALIIEIADRIRPFVEKIIGTDRRHLHKKSKYILEEDSHWVDEANEDVISLLSSSFTEENSTILSLSATKGKHYPLIFLTLMVITNIYPLIANCSIGTHDMKCMRLTSENLSTFQLAIYQIGNICCSLLAFGIMWNLFRLQKSKLPASYLRWNTLNFLLGSLGGILFFAFVLVNSQNENGLDQEIAGQNILNFYSIIAMAYSFYNLRVMKTRVGRQREASARKRMACYIFKNAYYLVMLSATIFYFILQVSQFMLSEQDPQSVLSVLMMNYNEIMRTICVIMSQAYIALYYIDINYIYEDGFSSEKKEQFENKKLMLSML